MSQHDYSIANAAGATVRADINSVLSAIVSQNSGASEPATTFAYEWWADTTNSLLKIRNSGNTGWVTLPFSISADNTVDINAGTVNGISSLSFASGSTVTSILDEDNLSSDSSTALATQQSIKAYVDSQVTAQDLDFQADSGGVLSIDLDSEVFTVNGGTGIDTAGAENTVTINIDSTVATLTGNQTLTNKTIDLDSNTLSNIEVDNFKSGVLDTDLSSVSASDDTLASAKAIKSFVESAITAEDLDISDGSNSIAIDLDSEVLSLLGGTGVTSAASGNGVTFSIGQSVATSDDVTFNSVASALTGNVTGQVSDISNHSTSALSEGSNLYYTDARFDTRLGSKDTGDLSEGSNLYFTNERVDDRVAALIQNGTGLTWTYDDTAGTFTGVVSLTPFNTSQLTENTNLYYTQARFDSAFSAKTTNDLTENTNLYYTQARFDSAFSAKTTNDLTENTNLYYTDTRANAAIDARVNKAFVDALSIEAASVAANSVALSTDTTGDYVAGISGTSGEIEVTGSGGEGATVTIGLPDDVTIAGNLVVNGTTTSVNTTTLEVEDPLIKLAKSNSGADSVDIGFYGLYDTSGSQDLYAGLFRDANDSGKFKLFKDLQAEPTTTVNTSGTGYAVGSLVANIEGVTAEFSSSVGIGGGSTNGVVIEQGSIKIKNGGTQSLIDFYCESNNAHYVRLQAPAHSAFSGNPTVNLPANSGNIVGTGDTGTVTNTMLDNSTVNYGGISLALGASDTTPAFDLTDATNYPASSLTGSIANSQLANNSIVVSDGSNTSSIALGQTITYAAGEGLDVVENAGTITYSAEDATSSNKGVASFTSDFVVSSGAVSLNVSGVTAATYGSATAIPVITVDAKGRITSATTTAISTGFTLSDGSNTQTIAGGDTLNVAGTSNEVDVVVSATDTLTIGLPNDVTVSNNLTVSGNLVVTGTTTQTGSVVTDNNFTGLTNANTGNATDFGFYGKFVESGTTKYAGLFYDASTDNTFRLFSDTQTQPSTTVNTGATGYVVATLIANLTGDVTGDLTGNADTATALAIARTINGVSFDGSANITTHTAGTGVSISGTEISIGQAVATSDSPTFTNMTLNGTGSIKVPSGTTGQRDGSPANGMFRYNTTDAQFEGYADGAWGAIAGSGGGASAMETNNFTGDGSTTAFTLSSSVSDEDNLLAFIEGVYQNKADFVASGTTITFDTAPANGRNIVVHHVKSSISGSNVILNSFTGDGSDTTFTLSTAPQSENNTQVYLNGVYQNKSTYSVSGTTLTFDAAPANTVAIEVMMFTQTTVNEPATNSVGITQLNVSDGSNGQVLTTDGSGTLSFATVSGTTINNNADNRIITGSGSANTLEGEANLTFDNTNLVVGTTGALKVPNGTTAQKPTASTGMIRYNTTNTKLEAYIGSDWVNIDTSAQDLTQISGLQVWADVTGGISSTTVADLSGNNRTGTLNSATTHKGTLSGNTYFEAFGSNTITYAAVVLTNLPYTTGNACTFFFVCTNRKTYNTYATYLGSTQNSVNYQIIRHDGTSANYNFYAENLSNWQVTASNAAPVNSTISEAYILIFTFKPNGGNSDVNIYKHENGSTTSETHSVSGNNQSFELTDNNSTVTIGTSSWSNEYLNAGVFAWGATNTEMSSADRQIIYDYYANKGLAN